MIPRPLVSLVLLALLAVPASSHAAASAPAVALPDTGLFAPVAAQLRERESRLAKTTKPGAERIGLLLATGGNELAAREAAKDPRRSIEERYRGREQYLAEVTRATRDLVKAGYLLNGDVSRIVQQAGTRWDYATSAATRTSRQ